jgi:hypothetical protein
MKLAVGGVLLIGLALGPGAVPAACNTGDETGAVSVYDLSGQGNFSCADLNMSPVSGVVSSPSSPVALDWLLGTATEVDTVVVQDSSGKRCVYNYGPGATGGVGLSPPADKPIANTFFCADGNVKPAANNAPIVDITEPFFGVVNGGVAVDFAATVWDEVQGLAAELSWNSSIDGFIGTGGSLPAVSDLSAGKHVITAQVIDSGGLIGSDSIDLEVLAAEIKACSQLPVVGVVNETGVTCPMSGEPRLVCSADLTYDADKFRLGTDACCVCNATAVQCDPDLAWDPDFAADQQPVDPVTGLGPCPLVDAYKKVQVPSILMFNNDPYYCYTVGGKRTCFAY